LNLAKTTQKSGGLSIYDKNDTLIRLKNHPQSTALILICWTSDNKGRQVYHERKKKIEFSLGGFGNDRSRVEEVDFREPSSREGLMNAVRDAVTRVKCDASKGIAHPGLGRVG